MKNNIIKYDPYKFKKDQIMFDSFIATDSYLQLTSLNALQKAGYEVSVDGVKCFQEMNDLSVDGIINVECLTLLIQVFDEDQIQDIVSHIDKQMMSYRMARYRSTIKKERDKANNKTTRNQWLAILWILFFSFFFGYGLVTCITNIIKMIGGL